MKCIRNVSAGKLLIGAGCLLLASAVALWLYGNQAQQRLLAQYAAYTATFTPSSSPAQQDAGVPAASLLETGVIGVLQIPKLGISAPFVEGTTDQALQNGVGHFSGTALPGETGNVCVAGHSSGVFDSPFARLDRIEPGDLIEVSYQSSLFSYRVTQIRTVSPEEVSVLDPTDTAQITLVSCTPPLLPTHRLIVTGVLQTK